MFTTVGRDPDPNASSRRTRSGALTTAIVAMVSAISFTAASWQIVDAVQQLEPEEIPLIDLIIEDPFPTAPPAPAPPPPAMAKSPEPAEQAPSTPDEMVEEVADLDRQVHREVVDETLSGSEDGVEGGDPNGDRNGKPGGTPGGDPAGALGAMRVFHHSELEVKKRVEPHYPQAAVDMGLAEQRCTNRVFIDGKGVPWRVDVSGCPAVFHETARAALLRWRWYPPRAERQRVSAQTTIVFRFTIDAR